MGEALESWLRSRGEGSWSAGRAASIQESMTLFDEHTWGAYSSVEAPHSLFSLAQWNRKAGFAYTAAMEGHNLVARAANALAAPLGKKGPEGIFNLGNLDPGEAFKPSGIQELLVFNTLPWERRVIVEEPEPRGGAAPVGMLDTFFNRRSGWGGPRPYPEVKRVAGTVPAMGYAFLNLTHGVPSGDLRASATTIENAHYRLQIDPATGGIAELFDKDLGHDFAGSYEGWQPGQYVYETVDSPVDRLAIADISFDKPEFFTGHTDTPWVREVASKVTLEPATIWEGAGADQGRRRGSRRLVSDGHLCSRRPKQSRAHRLDHRQARTRKGRGGVHRLSVRARRGRLHARPQRHPVRPQRGPARWRR